MPIPPAVVTGLRIAAPFVFRLMNHLLPQPGQGPDRMQGAVQQLIMQIEKEISILQPGSIPLDEVKKILQEIFDQHRKKNPDAFQGQMILNQPPAPPALSREEELYRKKYEMAMGGWRQAADMAQCFMNQAKVLEDLLKKVKQARVD